MPVKAVNIGEYGYMPFSFDCVKAVYSGGIYMKFAVFLHSDNSACKFFRNNQMYPCNTFKKIIEDNIDLIEFVDIFNMIMDKYIALSDNIIKRALDEISNNIKSEVRGVHIHNNTGYYKHLLNYCIIMYLVDLDFDLKLLEKFKDYSDTVCFVLDPNSFDYSKVDLNDYMWYNLIYSNKFQNYFIEHKNEVVSDELKRIFELGIDNREQQKIVYGILLDNNELQKF